MAASKAIGFLNFKFSADLTAFERAMKKAQKNLKRFGKNIERTGKTLTTNLTLPIAGLGAVAIKTFATFEQGMLKVKAISGATNTEFIALTASAKELGSTTMFTASQVAELQLNLSKLGFNPQSILESSQAILNLAQATDSDLGEAATVAASTMNAFGLEAKDMTMISDVMADSFSSSALDLQKFQTAMASVAPVANQAGADIQRTSAILGVLVNNGIEASSAGTALRNVFLELADQGLTWDEAMLKIQTSMNPLQTAMDLFGKRGASVATIIANNGLAIQSLTDDFNESAGEAQKMADIMDSGIAGAMRKLQSQTEGLLIQFGTALIPIFSKLLDKLSDLITWFSSLSDETKRNIVKWGLLLGAIGPVLMIIGKISIGIAALMTPIGLVTIAIGTLTGAFIYLKTSASDAAKSIRDSFRKTTNFLIGDINNLIRGFSALTGANIDLVSFVDPEENSGKKSKKKNNKFSLSNALQIAKGEALLRVASTKNEIALKKEREMLKLLLKEKKSVVGETEKYSRALDPLLAQIKDYAETMTVTGASMFLVETWTLKLTEAQKAHNATILLFEDIMFNAAMSAANSQEKFFKSFIANIKQAIKQLLIQLAVLTVISLLLGGPTMKIGEAFGIAKGKVLGLEGFADGGLVYGPTTALIGEGIGTTASNPEVVAPLDKLKQYMGDGNKNIVVEGVLKGNDIYLSNRNTSINRLRTT